jgi:hypothetical protein
MSKINDIFDLPEQNGTLSQKKERKKIVMTDEKKSAMLERLAKGRETRANNLLAKKGIKVENISKEQIKEPVKEPVKEVKVDKLEEERKAFINTMVGKSKPVEKFERPKKKIRTEGSDEQPKAEAEPKVLKVQAQKVEAEPKVLKVEAPKVQPPKVEAPKVQPPIKQSLAVPPKVEPTKVVAPVVFSTLKKPMWG